MDLKLQDKSALVSGSTKGIGFAIAALLAAEGARVIINGRTETAVKEASDRIRSATPRAKVDGFAGDLSVPGPTASARKSSRTPPSVGSVIATEKARGR